MYPFVCCYGSTFFDPIRSFSGEYGDNLIGSTKGAAVTTGEGIRC